MGAVCVRSTMPRESEVKIALDDHSEEALVPCRRIVTARPGGIPERTIGIASSSSTVSGPRSKWGCDGEMFADWASAEEKVGPRQQSRAQTRLAKFRDRMKRLMPVRAKVIGSVAYCTPRKFLLHEVCDVFAAASVLA